MDLYAFTKIQELTEIAQINNIEVPRLRGYRLMKNEDTITFKEIKNLTKSCEINACEDLCRAIPFWSANPKLYVSNRLTDYYLNYFLIKNKDKKSYYRYIGVNWNKIHGKKRRVLKFEIKKRRKRILRQYEVWNKYVGRDDVLYIHARIGGDNWELYDGKELESKDWFLEKIDDAFDSTYCDIYALIKTE